MSPAAGVEEVVSAGVDVVARVPVDAELDKALVGRLGDTGTAVGPTLAIIENTLGEPGGAAVPGDPRLAGALGDAWARRSTTGTLGGRDRDRPPYSRAEEDVRRPADAGVTLRGGLADLDVLRAGADRCDGVISLAFGRDYSNADALTAAITEESAAMATLGAALVGSDRPIVTVSGTPWVPGRASTEADQVPTDGPVGDRGRSQIALLDLASRGVRATAVRMPRTVHNNGGGGFAGLLTAQARRAGIAGYPGAGTQRWPAVHALDAAVLFRLALESALAGTAWHAVADEGDPVRDIAAVVGRRLSLPVEAVPEDAFGPFGPIFAMDQPASSAHTRTTLGWQPTHPSLLDDLDNIQP